MAEKLLTFKKEQKKCEEPREFLSNSSKLEQPRISINKYQGTRDEAEKTP